MRQALTRAIEEEENGLKTYQPKIDEDAMTYFATQSQGDVRSALKALTRVNVISKLQNGSPPNRLSPDI